MLVIRRTDFRYDPALDPHRGVPEVHWRLYLDPDGEPVAVCVQDHDYPDYDPGRFLDYDLHDDEDSALRALAEVLYAGDRPVAEVVVARVEGVRRWT